MNQEYAVLLLSLFLILLLVLLSKYPHFHSVLLSSLASLNGRPTLQSPRLPIQSLLFTVQQFMLNTSQWPISNAKGQKSQIFAWNNGKVHTENTYLHYASS